MAGSDLYTGTLDVLILKAVSWGPMHGYAINRWLRQRTGETLNVNEGALYPALHRLEAKGWLSEEWGVTDRNREAKFYTLTPLGRKQLRAEIDRWHEYSRVVSAALSAASILCPPPPAPPARGGSCPSTPARPRSLARSIASSAHTSSCTSMTSSTAGCRPPTRAKRGAPRLR